MRGRRSRISSPRATGSPRAICSRAPRPARSAIILRPAGRCRSATSPSTASRRGAIVEAWAEWDNLAALAQMGLAPGGARAQPGLHDFLDDGYGADGDAELARRLAAGEDLDGAGRGRGRDGAARGDAAPACSRRCGCLLDHGADIDARTVGREDRVRARRAPRLLRAGESAGGARGRLHARPCRPPRRRRCRRAARARPGACSRRIPGARVPATRKRTACLPTWPGDPAPHRWPCSSPRARI